jgi:hypothetical protein
MMSARAHPLFTYGKLDSGEGTSGNMIVVLLGPRQLDDDEGCSFPFRASSLELVVSRNLACLIRPVLFGLLIQPS